MNTDDLATDEHSKILFPENPCLSVFFRGFCIPCSSVAHVFHVLPWPQPWRNGCKSAPSLDVSAVGAAAVNVRRFMASSPQCLAMASTN